MAARQDGVSPTWMPSRRVHRGDSPEPRCLVASSKTTSAAGVTVKVKHRRISSPAERAQTTGGADGADRFPFAR